MDGRLTAGEVLDLAARVRAGAQDYAEARVRAYLSLTSGDAGEQIAADKAVRESWVALSETVREMVQAWDAEALHAEALRRELS